MQLPDPVGARRPHAAPTPLRRSRPVDWAPALLLAAAIFVASSFSSVPIPPETSDKRVHEIAYGLLAALILRALARREAVGVTARRALLAILLATLYGVSDEWHQRFVPGRTSEIADVRADASGAAVAAAALWTCSIIARSSRRRSGG